jgi:peptidoglycan/LPS O-acetylase OafA/YrhL
MNAVLCLIVIFIHVSAVPVTALSKGSYAYAVVFVPWRLSAFVVQGFIFLSGLKYFIGGAKLDYRKFYVTRLTRVLLPYVLWNLIYYAYFIYTGIYTFSMAELLRFLVSGTLVGHFYFIVVIVQFYLLMPLWQRLVDKASPFLLLVSAAVISLLLGEYLPRMIQTVFPGCVFMYNDRVFTTYLIYWLAGCCAGKYYDALLARIKRGRWYIAAGFFVLAAAEVVFSYIVFAGVQKLGWLNILHYTYCLGAVLFLFTLFTWVYEKRPAAGRLIRGIDAASYNIYLSHCLVIFLVNALMYRAGITRIGAAYAIRILAVYSVTLTLCIVWTKIKKRLLLRCGVLK